MTERERFRDQRARYERLKASGQCVQCKVPLETASHKGVRCMRCYEISCITAHNGKRREKSEKWAADMQKMLATCQTRSVSEQAADFGFRVSRIYALRAAARRRGHDIPNLGSERNYKGTSSKWAQLDALMSTPCKRCGLRGEHECMKVSALDRQPLIMPEGCRW